MSLGEGRWWRLAKRHKPSAVRQRSEGLTYYMLNGDHSPTHCTTEICQERKCSHLQGAMGPLHNIHTRQIFTLHAFNILHLYLSITPQ